jgi:hypothetical protein
MMKQISRFAQAGFALLLGLAAGSASAVSLPFFLLPGGTAGGPPVTPGAGSTVFQLWVDPSAIAGSTFGIDGQLEAHGALTMTAFAGSAANGTTANLNTTTQNLNFVSGDAVNSNSTPFEIGTLTIANSGAGLGDVTLFTGDFIDSNFATQPATTPQTIAFVPEPGTLLLLGAGVGGIAVLIGRSRKS